MKQSCYSNYTQVFMKKTIFKFLNFFPLPPRINEKKFIVHCSLFIVCICLLLPFKLKAQEASEAGKMSYERADSLLIALSKGKLDNSGESTPNNDTIVIETRLQEETIDTLQLSNERREIIRKRADVDRNELLIEQAYRKSLFKEDDPDVDFRDLRSINEGTLIGAGGYMMKDSYLSSEKYGGLGFRFLNERMRLTKLADKRISRQNIVSVDISSVMNGARNANFLSAFADYSYGFHYRFIPDPYFKILVGGNIHGMIGMVYNTRNGNNPLTVHADIDLNFSLLAIYEFRIKRAFFAVRYQFDSPFFGVLFSPVYEQSYYEIFSLGNTAEIYNFNSLHNKFAMRNYLTLDIPVGNATVRVGYLGSYYTTNVNEIDRYIISHNVMLGLVKEFVAFGGRELRRRNLFNSAYY